MPASPADGDRYAQRVARLVDDLEAALLRVLADTLTKGAPDTRTWAAERLAELQWLKYRAAQGTRTALAELEQAARDAIIDAYNHGTATAIADLEALGRPPVTVGGLPAAATALRLADEPVGLIRRAVAMVPEILGAAYSEAVAAGALDVLAGTSTRLAASQRVLDRLLADGIRGFTDSRGRRWSLDTYVEMAVRTTTGNAAVAGHVAQLGAAGVDLVVVSDSPRECPACRPWEGKVLSLSGAVAVVVMPSVTDGRPVSVSVAGTLTQAKAAGLQHPNCAHRVTAYLPGATKLVAAQHDPLGYAAKQRQREIERHIRSWKRREAVALTEDARLSARVKVRDWQRTLRAHVAEHDLKRLPYRERVGGSSTPLAH